MTKAGGRVDAPVPGARYIMIGGFLGAGKTTAIGRLARRLTEQGTRVGIITNDQGQNLVDTITLRAQGFATEEIAGGCFCCRFDELVEAVGRLREQSRPQVLLAEPVGSCTDLLATVAYPLRRLYSGDFTVAPVSVLVDPFRAERIFKLAPGGVFSDKVAYIYRKQIEEADLVVLTKIDLFPAVRLDPLRRFIEREFPGKEILAVSPREGQGIEAWFARLLQEQQAAGMRLDVDYDAYAEGEASLGWLNCTAQLQARRAFDADRFLEELARGVRSELARLKGALAHLKITFVPEAGLPGDVAVLSLVRGDFVPEFAFHLEAPVTSGRMVLNLRAELAPESLAAVVQTALTAATAHFTMLHGSIENLEHFRPGRPVPTHRFTEAAG